MAKKVLKKQPAKKPAVKPAPKTPRRAAKPTRPEQAAKARARAPAAPKKGGRVKSPVRPMQQAKPVPGKAKPLMPAAQLKEFRAHLQQLHDRVVEEIEFLASDNLNRSPREVSGDLSSYSFHMADHGTDNFDREFALNLVSSGQDVLHEINDAMRRLDTTTYGACEQCGQLIETRRLKALPFAKMCIKCQSAAERGRERFRRFGQTISQVVEPTS
ncbi:MAG: TraR/DksA C4-type zinc finger protein [Kiritimatiellaeota bacterium]|nr:TraR/DksA C4-type zinc finger protein [Kiritimatiellota bacterium]